MDKNKNLSCSFCGRSEDDVKNLIRGIAGNICDECIEMCHTIVNTNSPEKEAEDFQMPLPSQIKSYLDQYVIGQEGAKEIDRKSVV